MGIFSGSGVGKSVLLGMMARYTAAEVIVIALIGERGREVNEFIERDLGPAGLAKSVVVVATSNEPAVVRTQAASTATAVAEYFRDQGKDVLLLMDSLTRFALAQREIGLAAGEPPATRGFTPSVFALLPKLVERAGRTPQGSITAFYAVLVEADDPNEPISDAVRGLLDGHTWLSRKLSSRGHYPAIDVLESISRLMPEVADDEHRQATYAIRDLLGAYRDHEDLISIGAYHRGSNKTVDAAIDLREEIDRYLRQPVEQPSTLAEAREGLVRLCQRTKELMRQTIAGGNSARRLASYCRYDCPNMSAFHFRLATLLRLREATRDRRRAELAEARRADDDSASQLERLSMEQKRLQERVPQGGRSRRGGRRRACRGPPLRRGAAGQAGGIAAEAANAGRRNRPPPPGTSCGRSGRESAGEAARAPVEQHRLEEERQLAKQLDEAALQAVGR